MNKAQDYDDNHLRPTESDDESSRCMNTAPNVSMTATLPTIAQGQKPLTANEMLRMLRPTPWPAGGCRRAAPELLIPSPGRPGRVSVRLRLRRCARPLRHHCCGARTTATIAVFTLELQSCRNEPAYSRCLERAL